MQPEGRDEDLDHTRFSESAVRSFEYTVQATTLKVLTVTMCCFAISQYGRHIVLYSPAALI